MEVKVKDFLKSVSYYNHLIERKSDRLKVMQSTIEYVSPSLSGAGFGGGDRSRKRTNALVSLIALEEELKEAIDGMVEANRLAMKMIDSVPDNMQSWILYRRYLDGWKWERIIEESGYVESWVYEQHKKGLDAIRQRFGDTVSVSYLPGK